METAAAMVAGLRVVARTSACRVADGLVALEDAGPADAVAGRGTEGPARVPRPCSASVARSMLSPARPTLIGVAFRAFDFAGEYLLPF